MVPEHGNLITTPVQQWFVAFTSYRGSNKLYRKFLPYGFGHVFAFAPTEGGILLVDPRADGVMLAVPPFCAAQVCSRPSVRPTLSAFIVGLQAELPDVQILRTQPYAEQGRKHLSMLLPTCVTAIKSLLFMRQWVLTPKGLFNKLLGEQKAELVDACWLAQQKEADIHMYTQCNR